MLTIASRRIEGGAVRYADPFDDDLDDEANRLEERVGTMRARAQ
ncbi:hypothetical protein BTZ20_5083 [Rhodococcus sp. MTM3W5.2]|nr:hypothetical protein BTZ20_5083 [Rhodococcus sp. MTM3W5.2]